VTGDTVVAVLRHREATMTKKLEVPLRLPPDQDLHGHRNRMGHLPAQEGLGRDQARAKGEDAVTLDDAITEIARRMVR